MYMLRIRQVYSDTVNIDGVVRLLYMLSLYRSEYNFSIIAEVAYQVVIRLPIFAAFQVFPL